MQFPVLRTIPPNRPKWVHFRRTLPYSAKKSPFPRIKKAGRERTLSGQMTPFLYFLSSKRRLLSLLPYNLTFHQSKHAKITTQALYQNLGGYMCLHLYNDTSYDCRSDRFRVSRGVHLHPCAHLLAISPNLKHRILTAFIHPAISSLRCAG